MAEIRREVEVDTALAELHGRLAKVQYDLHSTRLTLARFAGADVIYETRDRRVVRETAEELIETVETLLAEERIPRYDVERATKTIQRWRGLQEQWGAILVEMKPLNDEFAAKQWSRFFLVQNHGGHIHSSMQCSTCQPTTRFGWLPELSGLTEKDAVEAHGAILCSVCYPTAPVEWTVGNAPSKPRCPGTGTTDYDRDTYRRTGWSGNGYAKCNHCETTQTVTKSMVLRAHKPKAEA